VSGLGFDPPMLTVFNGDRITWENTDLIVHTVTGSGFDSGDLAAGRSWTFVAKQPGTFNYACRYHPNMKGTLVVIK
jgi:plastocyanin